MIQGIEHVAIASPDPDALANWYVNHAGCVIEAHSPATRNYFLKTLNGSRLEIILAESPLHTPGIRDSGIRHLAWITDDLEGDYARLKSAAGIGILAEPEVRGGNRVVFFRDPDGNVLHLIQRPEPLKLS